MAVITSKQIVLPELINYVEYIQSSGTQYIDLGVSGSLPLAAELDVQTLTGTASADNVLLGSSDGTNFTLLVYWFQGKWFLDVGNGNGTAGGTLVDSTRYAVSVNATASAQSLKVNGNAIVQKSVGATGSTKNLFLFARNNNATPSAYAKAKVYGVKLYQSGALIRDFHPCYDPDGVACLYEKVEKKYYYNAGTGSFTAGGVV